MKARLVRIGNSRGVRLPKVAITEAGLTDEVELRVKPGSITICSSSSPRAGWAEAARKMVERGEADKLDPDTATEFDHKEWKW